MKLFLLLSIFLVAGCSTFTKQEASTKPLVVTTPVIDEQCASIAKYARALALMRDIRVTSSDATLILQKAPPEIELESFQRDIYDRITVNPVDVSINIYNDCVALTYPVMIKKYQILNETFRKDRLELIQTQIRKENSTLRLKLDTTVNTSVRPKKKRKSKK